jgi:hypothetical protein
MLNDYFVLSYLNTATVQHISPKGGARYDNTNKATRVLLVIIYMLNGSRRIDIYSLKECLHFTFSKNNQLNGYDVVDWEVLFLLKRESI